MSAVREKPPVGSLKISEDVIATIASVSAKEIPGVAAVAQPPAGRMKLRQLGKKPIVVNVSDDFVDIDISLHLEFGAKITEVCSAVQSAIKDSVQTMAGMAVGKVNVLVSGITFQNDSAAGK